MKHLHTAVIYQISNHEVVFSYAIPEYSSLKQIEIMKLNKKISQRNIDGMFRLILLIYGRIMKNYLLKFM